MNSTPLSLLERLRESDPVSWDRFVELYTPLLFGWTSRMGLQLSDAADVVQDVFVILVQKLPEFHHERGKSFRAWLKTVTLNRWRTRGSRQAREVATDLSRHQPVVPGEAEAIWEAEYRQHLVQRALTLIQSDFEPQTWEACRLCVMEDLPASEVANRLGLSVAAVYTAKSRVLRHLRQELAGMLD